MKRELRQASWEAIRAAGAGRFPGILNRIPNFKGAEAAARHLCEAPEWTSARAVKINPDSPQRPLRHAALKAGKLLYLPAPKLAADAPFIELDPAILPPEKLWHASSIKGAFELGRPVRVEDMPTLDLIVSGCVAVGRDGARLGKGGGYADLEYALLREAGKVDGDIVIATSVHAVQLVSEGVVPMTGHDLSVDLVATPEGLLRIERSFVRPAGVIWEELSEKKVASIPVLQSWPRR